MRSLGMIDVTHLPDSGQNKCFYELIEALERSPDYPALKGVTLAKAEKSHAGRFQKALDRLSKL